MKRILYILSAAALAVLAAACVKDKVYDGVSVSGLQNSVAYDNEAVSVSATVSSLVDITKVELKYKLGSAAEQTVEMSGSKGVYTGTIPGAADGTKVTWRVAAYTESSSAVSAEASYTVGEVPVDYTGLRLNELNGNDKFIELYNAGQNDIRIKGIQLVKDGKTEEPIWTAASAIMKPGAYLLLYSEDVTVAGEAQEGYDETLVFHAGLSAKKAVRIQLMDPQGGCLDDFNFAKHPGTKYAGSYGLNADGKWYNQTEATPGKANVDGTDALDLGE